MTAERQIETLQRRLKDGGVVILDGGTGTELQRRGVPMHDKAWCAAATLSHAEVLREIHEDYVHAGADVLIANTYASNRAMLDHAGLGDQFVTINRRAVEIAREARARAAGDRLIAVAGSMSHMVPVLPGTDRRDPDAVPPPARFAASCRELADCLVESGVDLIIMEMMSDPDLAVPAVEAACATGMPVWIGLSARAGAAGPVAFSRPELPFELAARQIVTEYADVAGVMHSNLEITADAIDALKDLWPGVLMVYPDSGYFAMPEWRFDEGLAGEAFAARARSWRRQGVQVIGGCCGIGVEHIAALSRAFGGGDRCVEA